MTTLIRRLLIITMGALLISASAQPASAGNGGTPTHYSWGCITGTLSGSWLRNDSQDSGYFGAHIARCSSLNPYAVFSLAIYDANGTATGRLIQMPASTTISPTSIGARLSATSVAVCLVKGELSRVDCLAVSPERVMTHITVDDPRVQVYVPFDLRITPGSGPSCPSCLD